MKPTPIILAVFGFAAILQPACTKNDSTSQAVQSTKTAAKDIAVAVKDAAVESWDSPKDYTYEKRADFADRLDRMAAKRAAEVAALNAKVTGLPDTAAKARDQANKDFAEALAYLKTQTEHVRTATADTWSDAKEKTAEAWKRVQAAYEKVQASPAS